MIGSSASGYAREDDDWYVEPVWSVAALLKVQPFTGMIYDPACGGGNIPKTVIAAGGKAVGSDLRNRGYGVPYRDFFGFRLMVPNIVSNPPYGVLDAFVRHALAHTTERVAILARLSFLEGQERHDWFKLSPLKRVWVSSRRISMPPGAKPEVKAKNGSVAFAWFVWEHGFEGQPTIGWLK